MEKINFDTYAEEYEKILNSQLKLFDGHEYFAEHKVKILSQLFPNINSILEFGCGVGSNLKWLTSYFPNTKITGCEVSLKSLEVAKKNCPNVDFFLIGEECNKKFDLIFAANVFHHIPVAERTKAVQNIYSHLAPGGSFVIFEHNPYNPVTRYLVSTCVFDKDAVLLKPKESKRLASLKGFSQIKHHYILFFPKSLKTLRFIEPYLGWLPLGGQYCMIAKKDK